MFEIGEKVVCVNDEFPTWARDTFNQLPIKGIIYTVRGVELGRSDLNKDSSVSYKVVLEELHNDDEITPMGRNLGELGFRSDRFATLEQIHGTQEVAVSEPVEGIKILVE